MDALDHAGHQVSNYSPCLFADRGGLGCVVVHGDDNVVVGTPERVVRTDAALSDNMTLKRKALLGTDGKLDKEPIILPSPTARSG